MRNTSARAALGLSSASSLSFQDGAGAPGEFAPLISDVTVIPSRVTGLTTSLLRWVCIRFLSCCNKAAQTVWPKTTELHCLTVPEAESQNSRRRQGRAPSGTFGEDASVSLSASGPSNYPIILGWYRHPASLRLDLPVASPSYGRCLLRTPVTWD